MKENAKDILGKTIDAVVIRSRVDPPQGQLFLVFNDGTFFEFYSYTDKINPTGGPWTGTFEDVRRYMAPSYKIEFEAQRQTRSESSTPKKMDKNLD